MTTPPILGVALPTPVRRLFDYFSPQGVEINTIVPGVRVRVPFQSRTLIGVVVEIKKKSQVPYAKLKHASRFLDFSPVLSKDIFELCQWAAAYYHCSLGEAFACALPKALRQGRPLKEEERAYKWDASLLQESPKPLSLNTAQKHAVSSILASKNNFSVFLLDGITGSGKTEVYLRCLERILCEDKQALVLVPEISLTPQTIARFQARFSVPLVALHSGLTEAARLRAWCHARSGKARIVIGTRSAVFAPFANLGIVVVDEEHDPSFKQQDRFRYHARDLAIMRAKFNQVPIVLGSATPSLETLLNVERKRFISLSLPARAGAATVPHYQVVDLQRTQVSHGLSTPLLQAMKDHLALGNQVMLFLNRRGFAPVLYCPKCTHIIRCTHCDANLVYHRTPAHLRCHHCDARSPLPLLCPQCKGPGLMPVGQGTQRLEETLKSHFPDVPIVRMDRDTTKQKGALENALDKAHSLKKAILLGTQLLAKGHHFPHLTLVGILDIDSGLFSADFRSTEQMGQLLLQVGGRAGRIEQQGTVIVQARHPDDPLLQFVLQQDYHAFAKALLKQRKLASLPPFSYFALFRAESKQQERAHAFLAAIKAHCLPTVQTISALGPAPALMSKRKGLYCQHLVIKANDRHLLHDYLKRALQNIEQMERGKAVKWALDVDPLSV